MARPYKCRGQDGAIYYVKNRQSGSKCAPAEWICGLLAKDFGLNLPDFGMVHLSEELIDECPKEWRDLGSGTGFGSKALLFPEWALPSRLASVPEDEQRAIVLFDWWVHNMDRTPGNTNLLWDSEASRVVVIDFNNAFDPAFDEATFMDQHVFASRLRECFDDMAFFADFETRLENALTRVKRACGTLPEQWRWANPEMDIRSAFDVEAEIRLLELRLTSQTWGPK